MPLPDIITTKFKSSPLNLKSNHRNPQHYQSTKRQFDTREKHFNFKDPTLLKREISLTKFSSPIQRYKPNDRYNSNKNSPKSSYRGSISPVEAARGFEAL